jgi:hypothetical protein
VAELIMNNNFQACGRKSVVAVLEVPSRPVTKGNEKNHAKEIETISSKIPTPPQASM